MPTVEVKRRFVNSLPERLRRRLRELGRPLGKSPSLDSGRHSSHAEAGHTTQRRTEIELSSRRQSADRTGTVEEARLPAQQPPPPKSTRLKAAVFSRKRHPASQRRHGTIWGPTSFLDVGERAAGDDKTDRKGTRSHRRSHYAASVAPDGGSRSRLGGATPPDGAPVLGLISEISWPMPEREAAPQPGLRERIPCSAPSSARIANPSSG